MAIWLNVFSARYSDCFKLAKDIIIAASMLSADFSEIGAALVQIENSGVQWVHLDIMDGAFVPAITFGDKMVADIRKKTKLVLDAHLMIENPQNQIDAFAAAGADYFTFHIEAAIHSHRIIQLIHQKNMKAGVSIVPSTTAASLENVLPFADLVLVMTVNPGAGEQTLITECIEKIKTLSRIKKEKNYNYLISVDGGINGQTASAAIAAGADVLVTGSAFFKAQDKKMFVNDINKI
ncbi:MAG: ribulose-phosphate 3-epimerase [Termitinemataceae bacterium]|nr:MAG: ribulose-phosphate 3-epimerase [Termitinemataceae bacterium]